MQITVSDPVLINIYNIKNLEFVHLFDLNVNKKNKILVIPALMIGYDGGKTLTLCSKDKYFDVLVKKVVEVYNDEKNNILEDSLTDPFKLRQRIEIDERTKKILSNGELEKINEVYEFYDQKDSYDETLLFQKEELSLLIPIIKYHVERLFSLTDQKVFIKDDITGYRNNYVIPANVNGIFTSLLITFFKKKDNEYEILIGGLIKNNVPLKMTINFNEKDIEVCSQILTKDYNLESLSQYVNTNENIKMVETVKKDGIVISYENKDLLENDNKDMEHIANIDCLLDMRWFKLPWGGIYGIDNSVEEISETEKIIIVHNVYINNYLDNFNKLECYTKSYLRNPTATIASDEIILDEVVKNMVGLCINKEGSFYIIETNFIGDGKNGYYLGNLANKYFYHIVKATNGVEKIKKDDLRAIGKKDEVLVKTDILNQAKMLKLMNRG